MSSRLRFAGSDYSQSSIDLARAVAKRRGVNCVQWRVDDVLHPSSTERCASVLLGSPYLQTPAAHHRCGGTLQAAEQGCSRQAWMLTL